MEAKWNILGGCDGRLTLMLGCWEHPCRPTLELSVLGFGVLGVGGGCRCGFLPTISSVQHVEAIGWRE